MMENTVVEEPPTTWTELSRKLGVPQPLVSQAARYLITSRSSGPLPAKIPSPIAMGREFVVELSEMITNSSIRRKIKISQGESKGLQAVDLDRQIREALDENAHMIGDNMIEFVADKLMITRSAVQRVMKERYDALCFERKIKAAEAAYQAEQQALKRAKLGRRSEAADNSREAALGAHRQRSLPDAYKPAPAPPATPPEPQAPLGRPACFPQPGENVPLDKALRAAWIQGAAGMANERLAAEMELVKQYPPATIVDAYDAIELAYSARPNKQKREMERKAQKLAKARAEQTSQVLPQTKAQAPAPHPPESSEAKKT